MIYKNIDYKLGNTYLKKTHQKINYLIWFRISVMQNPLNHINLQLLLLLAVLMIINNTIIKTTQICYS